MNPEQGGQSSIFGKEAESPLIRGAASEIVKDQENREGKQFAIEAAQNLTELYDVLRGPGKVQGSKRMYTGREIVGYIDNAIYKIGKSFYDSDKRDENLLQKLASKNSLELRLIPRPTREKVAYLLLESFKKVLVMPESYNEQEVVSHNTEMLNKDMDLALQKDPESIGGNAGVIQINEKKYMCFGVNGYAHPASGQIILFTNEIYKMSPDMRACPMFTLVMVAGLKNRIVEFLGSEKFGNEGRQNIEKAIDEYNKTKASNLQE